MITVVSKPTCKAGPIKAEGVCPGCLTEIAFEGGPEELRKEAVYVCFAGDGGREVRVHCPECELIVELRE
jgi:hypothetical protein